LNRFANCDFNWTRHVTHVDSLRSCLAVSGLTRIRVTSMFRQDYIFTLAFFDSEAAESRQSPGALYGPWTSGINPQVCLKVARSVSKDKFCSVAHHSPKRMPNAGARAERLSNWIECGVAPLMIAPLWGNGYGFLRWHRKMDQSQGLHSPLSALDFVSRPWKSIRYNLPSSTSAISMQDTAHRH
jgi:hypothetical protein